MQNKKSNLKLLTSLLIASFLTGCSGETLTKDDIYTGIGAGFTSLIGAALACDDIILTLASTVVEDYIGNKDKKEIEKNN